MFSLKIVDTDAFLDMPQSSQLLYYHLAMRADDDGFVPNPKKIMRMTGAQDDDYKVLLAKKFIIQFSSGVCVIKHWLIHNLIRGDRYSGTQWIREREQLEVDKKTKKYRLIKDVIPNGNQMAPQVRLGKVRLGKGNNPERESQSDSWLIPEVIKSFEDVNPSFKRWYGNKTQRSAIDRMLTEHGMDTLLKVISLLPKTNTKAYFPTITTPAQLENDWAKLRSKLQQEKDKQTSKGRGIEL